MVALLVTGHGKFATGICSALDLIAGKNKHILAVDFEMEDSTDDVLICQIKRGEVYSSIFGHSRRLTF